MFQDILGMFHCLYCVQQRIGDLIYYYVSLSVCLAEGGRSFHVCSDSLNTEGSSSTIR